ncbi:hypothetical protein [Stigmatella aurantiaca]|uniref:Conserved uncharacterized protein n=1 Tax=Stigmatella aurantiaca (strain DW4/3-1) TaxID=378806 RepID=Q093L1_STIAD|nr:hypothetical protein [Stigmatella aurantiaca]ADO72710.1 conserved uncharacterized protein [Stigmatella aurantiaca DW4/3-1]EAU66945.1 conserved hypothetical protein [Stigmatella aurantiaca DW4/3-1]
MRIVTDAFIHKAQPGAAVRERSLSDEARSKLWLAFGLQGFLAAAYIDYFGTLLRLPKGDWYWKLYDTLRERYEEPDLAQRFQRLATLPEGTFGHEFWKYCQERGIPMPGHPHALPVHSAVHDFVHLLSGYGVSIWEEMLTTTFSLGFMFNPKARNYDPARHKIVIPVRMLARLIPIPRLQRALDRGSAVTVDLFGDWDPWKVMEMPLEDVRRMYNIQAE